MYLEWKNWKVKQTTNPFINKIIHSFVAVHSNNTKKDILATQTLEQLVVDIGNIRTHLNTTELQLYEANEKISELIENVSLFCCRMVSFAKVLMLGKCVIKGST